MPLSAAKARAVSRMADGISGSSTSRSSVVRVTTPSRTNAEPPTITASKCRLRVAR
jgi:hypothetical protein